MNDESITRCESVQAFRRKTIIHEAQEEALEQVMALLSEEHNDDNLVIVAGPTGVGKSTLRKMVIKAAYKAAEERMKKDPGLIPIIGLEVFKTSERSSIWKALHQDILKIYRDPTANIKRSPEAGKTAMGQVSKKDNTDGYRQAVLNQFELRNTGAWILDEAHHLLYRGQGRTEADNLDTVKSMCFASATKCVLIGPYPLAQIVLANDQLARRAHVIHFGAYGNSKAAHAAFMTAARNLTELMPLPLSNSVCAEELTVGSLRCVGLLKNWLAKAVSLAKARRAKEVTSSHLRETRYSTKQLETFIEALEIGEELFCEDPTKEDAIRRYLGFAVEKPAAAGPTPRRLKPGNRNTHRDPIL